MPVASAGEDERSAVTDGPPRGAGTRERSAGSAGPVAPASERAPDALVTEHGSQSAPAMTSRRTASRVRTDGRGTGRTTRGTTPSGDGVSASSVADDSEPIATPSTVAGAPPSAYLHIGARPWAEVFVDGRRVGQTPITALALPPGRHQVRLVNAPLDAQRTIDVRLSSGETRYIREQME